MTESSCTQLIRFKNSGEFELTIEGIQLLQSLPGPLGIISILGPPLTGKSTFAKKLVGASRIHESPSTLGIWACTETIKVIKRDEDGTEYKADVLVIDCEAIVSRADKNKTRGLEILTLACLISSHIVYFDNQPLHTQSVQDLDIFPELPNVITIRRHMDSFKALHEHMPVLTWVIYGSDIKAPEESAGGYFEKMLSMQSSPESSKIKAALKSFFRIRNCFNALANNKIQYHRLVEYIQQATPTKSVLGISITGPILCSMVQNYVTRLQKKKPAIIQSAFNRAVAAEARKNIEKLYVNYLENMGNIEAKLPCSEEELWVSHNELSQSLMDRFDGIMSEYSECEEITKEKSTVLHRMQSYYDELKEANMKQSLERCKELFMKIFDPIKKNEDFVEEVSDCEAKMLSGLSFFYKQATGPAALKVVIEEFSQMIPFFCGIIREASIMQETNNEDLAQEIQNLKKNREKSRQNEKKLKELLDETIKNYESQLSNKEKYLTELQSSCNSKVSAAENKAKSLARELKAVQQELDHIQKEKEILIDMEKDIFAQKIDEYEEIIEKLKDQIQTLENANEEMQHFHQKSISEKEEEIIELKQKEKFSESATESIQDYSMLSGLRRDIAEMFILLETEQSNNTKYVSQMDRIASLQSELNRFRLKDIENRNKIVEDYEMQISSLKDEIDDLTSKISMFESRKKSIKSLHNEQPNEDFTMKIGELERENCRFKEQCTTLQELINRRDEQIQYLYAVVETHKKKAEELHYDYEDKENELKKAKDEMAQMKDDNDILIGLMGYSLEVSQKKRNIQAISLSQIQSQSNRARVIKIFKKFGIPFD